MFGWFSKKGQTFEGDVCRADHPRHGPGYYAIGKDGFPNFRVPLRWVDDSPGDPDDGSGHFIRV